MTEGPEEKAANWMISLQVLDPSYGDCIAVLIREANAEYYGRLLREWKSQRADAPDVINGIDAELKRLEGE